MTSQRSLSLKTTYQRICLKQKGGQAQHAVPRDAGQAPTVQRRGEGSSADDDEHVRRRGDPGSSFPGACRDGRKCQRRTITYKTFRAESLVASGKDISWSIVLHATQALGPTEGIGRDIRREPPRQAATFRTDNRPLHSIEGSRRVASSN